MANRQMERIAYIETYAKDKGYGDNSILYALIRCLPARDALELLRRCYKDNPVLRDATLYVLDDLKGPGREEALEQLVEAIIQEFPELPANRRSSTFLCLGVLLKKVSDVTADRIMKFLLDSKYAAGRRKGLKLLQPEEIIRYGAYIERCAWEHREHVAVMRLITHYPAQYVHNRRQDFARILDAQWSLARLYLRAAEHDRNCVAELREIDGITYAYVKAKLEEPLSFAEAQQLIEQNHLDERLGLLSWAFGKMGLWDALVLIAEHAGEWQMERMQQVMARYDV